MTDHLDVEQSSTVWTCMSCGAISDRQSCAECGAECRPGRWVNADEVLCRCGVHREMTCPYTRCRWDMGDGR